MSDAYLIVGPKSGIFACHFDRGLAYKTAQAISGVVIVLPIAIDYRQKSQYEKDCDAAGLPYVPEHQQCWGPWGSEGRQGN